MGVGLPFGVGAKVAQPDAQVLVLHGDGSYGINAMEIARRGTPIVAVSGIVGGRALRGPADRMLATLGHEPTALGVARIYQGVADRFVLDRVDEALVSKVEALGMRTLVTDTIMTDDAARARLAAEVLAFAVAA
jgi:LPPG:FO 2-phospho-L-lactate transferase